MSIQLRDSSNNTQILSRKDNTWWINGFIANNASLDDLTMDISITFPDSHIHLMYHLPELSYSDCKQQPKAPSLPGPVLLSQIYFFAMCLF